MKERASKEVHIYVILARGLIINRDEQLGTTEIDPAVRSDVTWH